MSRPMDASHATAANIRAAIGRQNMVRAELARRLNVTDMWLARRLNDQVPLTVDDLTQIADVLGVTPASLLPERASA